MGANLIKLFNVGPARAVRSRLPRRIKVNDVVKTAWADAGLISREYKIHVVYDDKGLVLKWDSVTGDAHAGVPTPHAIDSGHNKLPDGLISVQSPSSKSPPRGISAEEVP